MYSVFHIWTFRFNSDTSSNQPTLLPSLLYPLPFGFLVTHCLFTNTMLSYQSFLTVPPRRAGMWLQASSSAARYECTNIKINLPRANLCTKPIQPWTHLIYSHFSLSWLLTHTTSGEKKSLIHFVCKTPCDVSHALIFLRNWPCLGGTRYLRDDSAMFVVPT